MKILLVEDSEVDALLFKDSFEAAGHTVVYYKNGHEFCESLPALLDEDTASTRLVLDLMMPEKDGYEVVREMGSAGLKIPTVLMTAQEEPYLATFKLLTEAFSIPILAQIRKPVNVAELVQKIDASE